jgi:hypothetical protein
VGIRAHIQKRQLNKAIKPANLEYRIRNRESEVYAMIKSNGKRFFCSFKLFKDIQEMSNRLTGAYVSIAKSPMYPLSGGAAA